MRKRHPHLSQLISRFRTLFGVREVASKARERLLPNGDYTVARYRTSLASHSDRAPLAALDGILRLLEEKEIDKAVSQLKLTIADRPDFLDAHILLAQIYSEGFQWDDLIALCFAGLTHHPEQPELYKYLVQACSASRPSGAALQFELERLDTGDIRVGDNDILCFTVLRNERARLPFFLEYYRRLGVDRFFFIDNNSTDGSREWLSKQSDVHLWGSGLSFKAANYGSVWFEILMQEYATDHWCLTVDMDEFIVFSKSPDRNLKSFCHYLSRNKKRVATGLMIDCYSDQPLRETIYREGTNPFELCGYIDKKLFSMLHPDETHYGNQNIYFGGMRDRVFPEPEFGYILNKSVLLFYQPEVVLTPGQHLTNFAEPYVAQNQLAVMHFKYFASLVDYAENESKREEHAKGAIQYKSYTTSIRSDQEFSLFDPKCSVRFESVDQLIALGAMNPEEAE